MHHIVESFSETAVFPYRVRSAGLSDGGESTVLNEKRIAVALPTYNAETTLRQTLMEIDRNTVAHILWVDDGSTDGTVTEANRLGLYIIRHELNLGYGAHQDACYFEALKRGADIIIMRRPDYQYTTRLPSAMARMILYGTHDAVVAAHVLRKIPLKEGIPLYKYVFNLTLTLTENRMIALKLSEYHSGYREFARSVLESVPFDQNSHDFIFDNRMIGQVLTSGFQLAEISGPMQYDRYFSSITFRPSVIYGLGMLETALQFRLARWNLDVPSYLNLIMHKSMTQSPSPESLTYNKQAWVY